MPATAARAAAARAVTTRAAMVLAATVLATVGVLALSPARPAWAHAQLVRTDPAADSTLDRPLAAVVLTFSEPVKAQFSTVVVTGSDRVSHSAEKPRAVDNSLSQAVTALPAGPVRVAWRTVSVDGHPIQGEFTFAVTATAAAAASTAVSPATASPATNSPATDSPVGASSATDSPAPPATGRATDASAGSGDGRGWLAAGLAAVAIGTAIGVAWLLRRRGRRLPRQRDQRRTAES